MPLDFIQGWLDWGETSPSPPLLRKWSAIGALSAILSRRVWLRASSRLPPLYPNLFIMLAAPPRVGKDLAINSAAALCAEANKRAKKKFGSHIIRFGGESITPKGLLDELNDEGSKQTIKISEKETANIHSLCYFLGEATTAIPEYDRFLIGIMNDLWNCKPSYREKIRGIEFTIDNPHLMLLLGNQPDTIFQVFPESVFKMGFTARMFFIYAPERLKKKVWLSEEDESKLDQHLYGDLADHLVEISQWSGQMGATAGFMDAVNDFENSDPAPVPGSRFEHWNGGRCMNTQKVAMCVAASEGTQTVTVHHWERAVEYLFEAEALMPHIFDNIVTDRGFSEDLEQIPKLFNGCDILTQRKLLAHFSRTRPPYEVKMIIDSAVQAGLLKPAMDEAGAPRKPNAYYLVN